MAVDEATLEEAVAHPSSIPTLRWYRWSEPTLSLGYFQSARDIPASLTGLTCVRRLTGGGAILHDHELTYSLVFPAGSWPRENFLDLVNDVHDEVRLATQGLAFVGKKSDEAQPEPFLCFERRSPLDLVGQSLKVVGSAQRKRTGALLQHGSILLRESPQAPHLRSVLSLENDPQIESFIDRVTAGLMSRWQGQGESGERTQRELELAESLAREKYASPTWTQRR
jgi:lipoate-protein ligase A